MKLLSSDEVEDELRRIGGERYHDLHPFHRLLHSGGCSKRQVQAWALNRYFYQSHIPLKDAALIARCDDPEVRRAWRARLADHDGDEDSEGGIEKWLKLAAGLGLDREYVVSNRGVLPATRFAVEAYLNFVTKRSLIEAIASSLTELFSPKVIEQRVGGMLAHYDFVTPDILDYFAVRPLLARRDSDFALDYVKRNATTPELQRQVFAALAFKCEVLWAMLDSLYYAYVDPGFVASGAFGEEHS